MPEIRTTPCRSCRAPGVWMKTNRGKNILVEADSVDESELTFTEDGKPLFEYGKHEAHFAKCPEADGWRKQ